MRISDWSSDVCSSDITAKRVHCLGRQADMGADWNTPRREKGDGFSHSLSAFQLHARSVAFLHYTRRAFERLRWRGFIAAKWHIDEDEAMIDRKSTSLNSSH